MNAVAPNKYVENVENFVYSSSKLLYPRAIKPMHVRYSSDMSESREAYYRVEG